MTLLASQARQRKSLLRWNAAASVIGIAVAAIGVLTGCDSKPKSGPIRLVRHNPATKTSAGVPSAAAGTPAEFD